MRLLIFLLTLMLTSAAPLQAGQKGLFIPYYEFAIGSISGPYSYPPDVPASNCGSNPYCQSVASLSNEVSTNNLVHPWNGAQAQGNVTALVNLRNTYPNVPISIVVNGGGDGCYWHDAGSVYDANFHSAMQTLRSAGVRVYGYIDPTVYTVSLASAKEKVDRWYNLYGDVIDGIFVDDFATSNYVPWWPYLTVAYYEELNQYIKAKRNPTIPSTVPLVTANYNQWRKYSSNQDYYLAPNAADYFLVAESTATTEDLEPPNVDKSKRWLLLYNTSSASVSDAAFTEYMTHVDWVVISERSYATYQFLPNWLTRQAQLLSAMNGSTATGSAKHTATMRAAFR